jgi:predicted metalloprotease
MVGGGLGILVIALIAMFFGVDPRLVLGLAEVATGPASIQAPAEPSATVGAPSDEAGRFVAVVLADTEQTWDRIFAERGGTYRKPTVVLFTGATGTACGVGQSAMGPFYCPLDQKVYIDLDFYRLLRERFRAPGDFAQAYVIAHEIGHHVQNQLGIMRKMEELRPRLSEAENNALSVRVELQADCFAGVWAHHANARGVVEPGDVDEALGAASAIGDDTIQRRTQGRVVPDSFTHGSSAQRARWFKTGLQAGRLEACDTFATASL